MEKIKWNQSEIEQMKCLYVNNQPLKMIARILNRTPTSVNKALSRFGIRHHRPHQSETSTCRFKHSANFRRFLRQAQGEKQWVTLDYVQEWLQERRIIMQKIICPVTGQTHFRQGSARITPAHAVMMFNKKRLEEGLEVCWVEKVSC